jgi:hypothetical protein
MVLASNARRFSQHLAQQVEFGAQCFIFGLHIRFSQHDLFNSRGVTPPNPSQSASRHSKLAYGSVLGFEDSIFVTILREGFRGLTEISGGESRAPLGYCGVI